MSERTQDLLLKLKQVLPDVSQFKKEEVIMRIEREIDARQGEIREIFSEHADSVIEHFFNYTQTMSGQRKLQTKCEEFTKKVSRVSEIIRYDEERIEERSQVLNALNKDQAILDKYQNYITSVRKIIALIKDDRYSNAIKIINNVRKEDFTTNSPLKRALPVLVKKIEDHLGQLMAQYWTQNRQKISLIGSQCFEKVLLNYHEKVNIYHSFFGRGSISNSGERKSVAGPSMPVATFSKMSEGDESLSKYIFRAEIQMGQLRQIKQLCEDLSKEPKFALLLRAEMSSVVVWLDDENNCSNEISFRKFLSDMLGFLLVQREISAYFTIGMNQTGFEDNSPKQHIL